MTNFPLRVIGFENKFHAVGCLIKGPHFVPETTSLSFLNLTKIWPKKYRFCPFLGYFPIAPLCIYSATPLPGWVLKTKGIPYRLILDEI